MGPKRLLPFEQNLFECGQQAQPAQLIKTDRREIMSVVSRGLRTASRSLRVPPAALQAGRPARLPATSRAPQSGVRQLRPQTQGFCSMASLRYGAPASAAADATNDYDPEIKDIADYVHNKPIDSELAVSRVDQIGIRREAHC